MMARSDELVGGRRGRFSGGTRALVTNLTVGSRWVKEQDGGERADASVITGFVFRNATPPLARILYEPFGVFPPLPPISFAARHFDSFLLN